jgi:hypothetical protein
MGHEAPATAGARLSSEAPDGTSEATFKVAPNELANRFWFKGGTHARYSAPVSRVDEQKDG